MAHIKNYMEEVVFSKMNEVLKDISCCNCDKCLLDIAAIALNNLPPRYCVTEKGELYSKVNAFIRQFEVDVITAITKAAALVNRNPRHENE